MKSLLRPLPTLRHLKLPPTLRPTPSSYYHPAILIFVVICIGTSTTDRTVLIQKQRALDMRESNVIELTKVSQNISGFSSDTLEEYSEEETVQSEVDLDNSVFIVPYVVKSSNDFKGNSNLYADNQQVINYEKMSDRDLNSHETSGNVGEDDRISNFDDEVSSLKIEYLDRNIVFSRGPSAKSRFLPNDIHGPQEGLSRNLWNSSPSSKNFKNSINVLQFEELRPGQNPLFGLSVGNRKREEYTNNELTYVQNMIHQARSTSTPTETEESYGLSTLVNNIETNPSESASVSGAIFPEDFTNNMDLVAYDKRYTTFTDNILPRPTQSTNPEFRLSYPFVDKMQPDSDQLDQFIEINSVLGSTSFDNLTVTSIPSSVKPKGRILRITSKDLPKSSLRRKNINGTVPQVMKYIPNNYLHMTSAAPLIRNVAHQRFYSELPVGLTTERSLTAEIKVPKEHRSVSTENSLKTKIESRKDKPSALPVSSAHVASLKRNMGAPPKKKQSKTLDKYANTAAPIKVDSINVPPSSLMSHDILPEIVSSEVDGGEREKVSILGLFEMTTRLGERVEGRSELAAAKLAVKHINAMNILPGYQLELHTNDTKVGKLSIYT